MLVYLDQQCLVSLCSTPSRSDQIGGSEPDPGCSDTTISLYQNHLSKTNGSVTFQLALKPFQICGSVF